MAYPKITVSSANAVLESVGVEITEHPLGYYEAQVGGKTHSNAKLRELVAELMTTYFNSRLLEAVDMSVQTISITPEVVAGLSYNALCGLARHLEVCNPKQVALSGTITLDQLGNFISSDAVLVPEVEPGYDEWQYLSEKRHVEAGLL